MITRRLIKTEEEFYIYIFVELMLNGIMGGEGEKYELAVENIFHKGFRLLGTLSSINIGNIIFRVVAR